MYIEQTDKREFAIHGTPEDFDNLHKGLTLAFNQEKNATVKAHIGRQIRAFKPLSHRIKI